MIQQDEVAFRTERRKGLGGSDMPIILGLSGYMTPYQLYLEKLGLIDTPRVETPNQYWGKQIEHLIRNEFSKRNNVTIEAREKRSHPILSYLKGNLDGWIKEWGAVFEAKCSIMTKAAEWSHTNQDGIPLEYLVQLAHYCILENATCGHLAVLIGGYDYREYKYERDDKLEKKLIEVGSQFWDAIQNQTPPPAVDEKDLLLMYPKHVETRIVAEKPIIKCIEQLRNTKLQISEFQKKETEIRFSIMQYMQDNEALIDENEIELATWKATKRGSRMFLLKKDKYNTEVSTDE